MATEKRLIDANAVIRETESIIMFRKQHHMPTIEYEALLEYLNKRPIVDAVEVVRCKDCAYCTDRKTYLRCTRMGFNNGYQVQRDDFCSRGEKENR